MVVGDLSESTEVAILGAGPGGYVAAIRLAQLGKEVSIISKDEFPGGTCLQRGCIPSKALIEAAKHFAMIPQLNQMGIHVQNLRVDFTEMQKWKDQKVKRLSEGILQLFKQHKIRFIHGEGKFLSSKELEIHTEKGISKLNFEHAIIATGSRPKQLKDFPFDKKKVLSSREILSLQKIPQSLSIIGGGYIGLEIACVLNSLGTHVNVIEAMSEILPSLDREVRNILIKHLKKKNIRLVLSAKSKSIEIKNEQVILDVQMDDESIEKFESDILLVAVGRDPLTQNIGLENIPIELDSKGFIKINTHCQTEQKNIYAIGDVVGGMMLAHKASAEAKIAAAHICGQKSAWDNLVPAVIFTDPEIAYVGLNETEAKERGIEVSTGMFPFAALGRAQTMEQTEGFIKCIAEKNTQRLIGVQMIGPHVSDLISEATLAIEMGARLEDLALTIHPHPTLSEALEESIESALGIPIHRFQRERKK